MTSMELIAPRLLFGARHAPVAAIDEVQIRYVGRGRRGIKVTVRRGRLRGDARRGGKGLVEKRLRLDRLRVRPQTGGGISGSEQVTGHAQRHQARVALELPEWDWVTRR